MLFTHAHTHHTDTKVLAILIPDVSEEFDQAKIEDGEKKLSENILDVLEHFKQPDPIGVPGASIPDPYGVPDMKQTLTFGTTLNFKNTAVYGISKFRIKYINAEIGAMEVCLFLDFLQINTSRYL